MNTEHRDPPPRFIHAFTPFPDILKLPHHARNTKTGQAYIRWEAESIRRWLATQPDRRTPVTDAEVDAERRQWMLHTRALIDLGRQEETFMSLPPQERAMKSAQYAGTTWLQKILRSRLLRLYKFPPEIVVHILGFLLDENVQHYRILLSGVCRQWREIVVKMPRI